VQRRLGRDRIGFDERGPHPWRELRVEGARLHQVACASGCDQGRHQMWDGVRHDGHQSLAAERDDGQCQRIIARKHREPGRALLDDLGDLAEVA